MSCSDVQHLEVGAAVAVDERVSRSVARTRPTPPTRSASRQTPPSRHRTRPRGRLQPVVTPAVRKPIVAPSYTNIETAQHDLVAPQRPDPMYRPTRDCHVASDGPAISRSLLASSLPACRVAVLGRVGIDRDAHDRHPRRPGRSSWRRRRRHRHCHRRSRHRRRRRLDRPHRSSSSRRHDPTQLADPDDPTRDRVVDTDHARRSAGDEQSSERRDLDDVGGRRRRRRARRGRCRTSMCAASRSPRASKTFGRACRSWPTARPRCGCPSEIDPGSRLHRRSAAHERPSQADVVLHPDNGPSRRGSIAPTSTRR